MEKCPLCNRDLGNVWDEHHLTPVSCGGKNTKKVKIHKVCHRKIHSIFTEKELAKNYYTIELLLQSEEIKKFVKWVSKKEPDFYDGSDTSNKKRRK